MRTAIIVAALGAICFLTSCAIHPDGRRMTFAEQWRHMAERQDAAARAFVASDDELDVSALRPYPTPYPPPRQSSF